MDSLDTLFIMLAVFDSVEFYVIAAVVARRHNRFYSKGVGREACASIPPSRGCSRLPIRPKVPAIGLSLLRRWFGSAPSPQGYAGMRSERAINTCSRSPWLRCHYQGAYEVSGRPGRHGNSRYCHSFSDFMGAGDISSATQPKMPDSSPRHHHPQPPRHPCA